MQHVTFEGFERHRGNFDWIVLMLTSFLIVGYAIQGLQSLCKHNADLWQRRKSISGQF